MEKDVWFTTVGGHSLRLRVSRQKSSLLKCSVAYRVISAWSCDPKLKFHSFVTDSHDCDVLQYHNGHGFS
jgi:hypothetical protein